MLSLNLKNRTITTDKSAFVMGIVNTTPDSFWSESRGGIERAFALIEEGADILDLGAESTRPGSSYISEEEEIKRLLPVIKEIRNHSDIPLSIDTRKKNVMKASFDAGADILNDISALEDDKEMASFCAESEIPVILMHKRGNPSTMQDNTEYSNVFDEVNSYLKRRVEYALAAGIKKDKIILDPGIGFGKDLDSNITLVNCCGELLDGEYPVLMALSRKTCIGQITNREVKDRLSGTLALDLIAVQQGAFMVRVHDVKETVDTLRILDYSNKIRGTF